MIHMIYDHEEHGPENLSATTDASKVVAMVAAWMAQMRTCADFSLSDEQASEVLAKARAHMDRVAGGIPKADRGQHDTKLMPDWGGLRLTSIEEWRAGA